MGYRALTGLSCGLSRGLSQSLIFRGVIAWVIACVFGPLPQNPPSFPAQDVLFFMEIAVNEAPRAVNSGNLQRYTNLQSPKAHQRRLKAGERLVRVLLGDPNVVCGTNTKEEVCSSGGACAALSCPLGCHLAFTAQEHEALSMLRIPCSMHISQRALLRMPRRCIQRDLRTVRQRIMPYFPQATVVRSTSGRNTACSCPCAFVVNCA